MTLGPVKVGNLTTFNHDPYPDLGDWFVQLRIGPTNDEVLARVYGDSPEQADERARILAYALSLSVREPVAYISHTSEGDILGWERQFDAQSHSPLYSAPQPAPDVEALVKALESMIKGYVSLLEAGIDRITSLSGDCDSVPDMLRAARAALAAYRKQGG